MCELNYLIVSYVVDEGNWALMPTYVSINYNNNNIIDISTRVNMFVLTTIIVIIMEVNLSALTIILMEAFKL